LGNDPPAERRWKSDPHLGGENPKTGACNHSSVKVTVSTLARWPVACRRLKRNGLSEPGPDEVNARELGGEPGGHGGGTERKGRGVVSMANLTFRATSPSIFLRPERRIRRNPEDFP
jgi:hypothetical protein